MERVLVVHGTTHGWTARIAERMAEVLRGMGMVPTVHDAARLPRTVDPRQFDGVLVAGSVQFGRHSRPLERFATQYAVELSQVPSAFVSVCGALAGNYPGGDAEAARYRELFAQRTGWRPRLSWSVPGRVAYTRYPFVLKQVMKFISWRTGRPTDTSRDWEFTDWAEVDRLAIRFGDEVRAARAALAPEQPATAKN